MSREEAISPVERPESGTAVPSTSPAEETMRPDSTRVRRFGAFAGRQLDIVVDIQSGPRTAEDGNTRITETDELPLAAEGVRTMMRHHMRGRRSRHRS